MRLENGDLCIRNTEKGDCEQLAKWWNDGAIMAHAGFPNGLNTSAIEIERMIASDSDDTRRRLVIEKENTLIGEMSCDNLGNGVAEIGIKICDSAYQGKGLGQILLRMLIRELFQMGYQKIILDTNLENKRAQHVYEKLGFTKVRVRVNDWRDQLGRLQSSVDYELTQERFVACE